MSSSPDKPFQTYSFTDFSRYYPDRQQPGDELDGQFDNIIESLTQTIDRLNLIQRDDGHLANESVYWETLHPSLWDELLEDANPKNPVVARTLVQTVLSGERTLQGIVTNKSRVLVAFQTNPAQNGIYITDPGPWTRVADADTWDELHNAMVLSTSDATVWRANIPHMGVIGTDPITFVQVAMNQTYQAGAGLALTGNVFSVDDPTLNGLMTLDPLVPGVPRKNADQTWVWDPLPKIPFTRGTIQELRALTPVTYPDTSLFVMAYYSVLEYADGVPKGGGWFRYDPNDTTSTDNGATVFLDATLPVPRRWKLQHAGSVALSQCGAKLDNSADDLVAVNRAFGLLKSDPNVNELIFDAGTCLISDNPNPIEASSWTIRGKGWGTSGMAFTAGAGDKSGYLTIGTPTYTAQRWSVKGVRFNSTANQAFLTGANAAIHILNSVTGSVTECDFVNMPKILKVGDESGTQARRTWFCDNHGSAGDADCPVYEFLSFTVFYFQRNYCGITGETDRPNRRIILVNSHANGVGCDGFYLIGNELNGAASSLRHGVEIDVSKNGVGNFEWGVQTLDGGYISLILIKSVGPPATSDNRRLFGLDITGGRYTSGKFENQTGVFLRMEVGIPNNMHGINVSGSRLIGGGALFHTRGPGVVDGFSSVTFTGNTIVNSKTVNGGNVFETDSSPLTITGNILRTWEEGSTTKFDNWLVCRTPGGGGANQGYITCTGNSIAELNNKDAFDLTLLPVSSMGRVIIANNSGVPDPASSKVTTVDASALVLGQTTLQNNRTFRVSMGVIGVQEDGIKRASYRLVGIFYQKAGVVYLSGPPLVTVESKSDALWVDPYLEATTTLARVRVAGRPQQPVVSISQANPAVCTYSGANSYANGDRVTFSAVGTMTEVNGNTYTVDLVDTALKTFALKGFDASGLSGPGVGGNIILPIAWSLVDAKMEVVLG